MKDRTWYVLFGMAMLMVTIAISAFCINKYLEVEDYNKYLQSVEADLEQKYVEIEEQSKLPITGSHQDVEYILVNDKLSITDIDECNTVTGISMYPSHTTGNTACWQYYDGKTKLSEGTIVLYKDTDGDHVIHRIGGAYNEYYLIQGDFNQRWEKIPYADVVGVVKILIYT